MLRGFRASNGRPLAIFAAALALVACGGSGGDAPGAPPAAQTTGAAPAPTVGRVENVLLVTVDTLRWDALGFAGNGRVETPVLDRLAAGGLVFDDAHAHNVVTLPSHANILTGRLPYEHGVRENAGFRLPEGVPTAATLLGGAGFATGAFVGAFPLDRRYGLGRGFDVYDDRYPEGAGPAAFEPPERRGDEVVAAARAWWEANAGRRRFLWVHLYDPHGPYAPPEPFASRYRADPYLGEVAATDAFLAPLLEPILDRAEPPTLVVFTSDHGEALGDHGEDTHGVFAYEATLKVPLVLWGPGLAPGRSAAPAAHVDLLPTLLAAAGVAPPPGLAGRSLVVPAAGLSAGPGSGQTPSEPPPVYFESLGPALDRGWAPLRGVIAGGRKLVALPIPELYDLAADPGEKNNLAGERRDEVRRLAALLPAESSWPPPRGAVSEAERAALESLGYLGGGGAAKTSWGPEDDPKRLVGLDRKMHSMIDLYRRGRLDEAIAVGREVIRARPDMGTAYVYLAQVLLQADRLDEAVAVMEDGRRRGVGGAALARQLGLSLAEAGRHREALAALEPLAGSGDPDVLNALGLVLSEGGRQEDAARALARVFETDPDNPAARQNLALVALRRRDFPAAEAEARKALAENPALGLAWNYLGTALYNQGRKREALAALQSAVVHEPGNFDALYNAGVVAMELGDRAAAREALARFAAEAPPERYAPDIAQAREWLRGLG